MLAADPSAPFPAVRVIGGPDAKVGKPVSGWVDLFGCNCGVYDVRDGGSILARDQWYENNYLPFHYLLKDTGTITLDTCKRRSSCTRR